MSIISITSQPMIPLSASYAYDEKLTMIPTYFIDSSTGYYGINNPVFNAIKDVKIINNSLFYITSAMNPSDIFLESSESYNTFDMAVFSSMKSYHYSTYVSLSGTEVVGAETNSDNRSLFRIVKNFDDTYSFVDVNFNYWTVGLNYPWNITVETKLDPDTYNQQTFNVEFSGSSIFIRSKFKNINYPPFLPEYYERFIGINPYSKRLGANGFILSGKDVFKFNLLEFNNSNYVKGYEPDSAYVKYYNEFTNPINNKNLEFKDITRNVKINYLVDCPYKTQISGKTLSVNLANLKNIHTPEYSYTKSPYFIGDTITEVTSANMVNAIKRREYNRMFMGSNQERGYENPCLGFDANTKELTFKKDLVTYFHYPKTAPQNIPIQYIGFVEAGAVPGNTPARADKIWKKLANYEKNIWWGNSTHSAVSPTSAISNPIQQGTWLCSWLSGDNTQARSGVWVDRWYYPGYATIIDALTLDTSFTENTGAKVWDEPSQMTFDGGCWYKYFHFGDKENEFIVDALGGETGNNLKLAYTIWDSNIVEDQSNYENQGIINDYNENVTNNETLKLNGTDQYCLVPYNSSYKLEGEFSVGTRVKVNDWSAIKGNHIISNGINNGWNIKFTNGYFTPIVPVFETVYGHIMLLNNDGSMYQDSMFPVSSHPVSGDIFGTPAAMAMDNNLITWITNNDANRKRLYKVLYTGLIDTEVIFDNNVSLDWVTIDANNNVWVLDTISNTASGFHTDTTYFSSVSFTSISAVNRIDFDTNNILLSADYTILDRCIDTKNNVYDLVSGAKYITKNGVNTYLAAGVTNIACDSNDILWVLKSGNRVVRTTSNGTRDDINVAVGQFTTGTRKIFFTNEYDNGVYKDFVWILNSSKNKLYKLTYNLGLLETINLEDNVDLLNSRFVGQDRELMLFNIKGDNTAYNWQLKFEKHNPRIQTEIVLNDQLSGTVILSYPTSGLTNGEFYNFNVTYTPENTHGKMYINSLLVDEASSINTSNVYYKYDNSMIIGGVMGNDNVLNEDIISTKYSMEGEIANLRIYDYALNTFDIKHIELLDYTFNDLIWNMPIGKQSFIEEIERFFKHKLPGSKSMFYNIRLSHLHITNKVTRNIIEEIIRNTVRSIAPAYTELYKIIWE